MVGTSVGVAGKNSLPALRTSSAITASIPAKDPSSPLL